MKVPWSLAGALVHNVVIALCVAPALHSGLTLRHRAEAAVTGFLLLDMFDLLAREKCSDYKLPGGSTFLAGQTKGNLQAVALSVVIVCLTKSSTYCPYKHTGRMSEMAIEHFFGQLRMQSPNSQLSTRQFWIFEGRYLKKIGEQMNKLKVPKLEADETFSEEQLLVRLNHILCLVHSCSFHHHFVGTN